MVNIILVKITANVGVLHVKSKFIIIYLFFEWGSSTYFYIF